MIVKKVKVVCILALLSTMSGLICCSKSLKHTNNVEKSSKKNLVIYHFEDSSLGEIIDSSGFKNNGRPESVSLVAGKIKTGAKFNGKNSFIKILHNDSFNFGSSDNYNIGFWIKLQETGRAHEIIGKHGRGGYYSFRILVTKDNRIQCAIYDKTKTWVGLKGKTQLKKDKWYHVIFSHSGEGRRIVSLYIDGFLDATCLDSSRSQTNNSGPIIIGKHPANVNWACCVLDEFFIRKGVFRPSNKRGNDIVYHPVSKRLEDESWKKMSSKIINSSETTAVIKKHKGRNMLFINETPCFPMIYTDTVFPEGDREMWKPVGQSGIHLYRIVAPFAFKDLEKELTEKEWWLGEKKYNFKLLEKKIFEVLSKDPEAYFLLHLMFSPPPWWEKSHPDEIAISEGNKKQSYYRATHSFGSQIWRKNVAVMLEDLIAHVKKSKYSSRIIGYLGASGNYGENIQWQQYLPVFTDYSMPNQKAFRKWLKIKYHGDIQLLRKRWSLNIKSFDSISIPCSARRKSGGILGLRNPKKEQDVIDYLQFHSEVVAESLCFFARTIKKLTDYKKLFGIYYGYLFEHPTLPHYLPHTGHLAMGTLLRCSDIDILISPISYQLRKILQSGAYMQPIDSIKLHNKLPLRELDLRTHLSTPGSGFGQTQNMANTLSVMKREIGNALSNNTGIWWYPIRGAEAFNHPNIFGLFADAAFWGRKSLDISNKDISRIAVIADEISPLYQTYSKGMPILKSILSNQREKNARIGAPCSYFLASDINSSELKKYKVFIFLNCFYLNQEQRHAIESLKKDGNILVWCYAPGFYDNNSNYSLANIYQTCNIKIKYEKRRKTNWEIEFKKVEHPYVKDVLPKYNISINKGPIFYVEDPDAKILATWTDTGQGAVAVRKFKKWTSVYFALPLIPEKIIRNIIKDARVHIFSLTDDSLAASEHFLSIHANETGNKTISLPVKVEIVYDLLSGKIIAKECKRFDFFIKKGETCVLYYGPRSFVREFLKSGSYKLSK